MKWIVPLLLISLPVQAWDIDRVGFGYGINHASKRTICNWRQEGHPDIYYSRDDKSPSKQIELGGTTSKSWLRWTAAYYKHNKTSTYGSFVEDAACHARDWGRHPPTSDRVSSSSHGVRFTFEPYHRFKHTTLYAKVGLSYVITDTFHCASHDTHLTDCSTIKRKIGEFQGFAPTWGAGVEFHFGKKSWFIEKAIEKNAYDKTSPNQNNRIIMMGLRVYL